MPSLTNGRMMCRVCSAAGVLGIARRRPANSCACAGSLKRSTDARTCYVALSLLRHTVSGVSCTTATLTLERVVLHAS